MSRLAALVACVLLSGCSLLRVGASVSAGPTPTAPPVPVGLPDAPDARLLDAGQPVQVGGATLTYLGTTSTDGALVSWFSVDGDLAEPPKLVTPMGAPVDLVADVNRLRSEPWNELSPSADDVLTVLADGELIGFRMGEVGNGDGPSASMEIPPPIR